MTIHSTVIKETNQDKQETNQYAYRYICLTICVFMIYHYYVDLTSYDMIPFYKALMC